MIHPVLLRLIFLQLFNEDVSLYNSIRVSRIWCRIGIPILWRNPFKKYKNNNFDSLIKVIYQYLFAIEQRVFNKYFNKRFKTTNHLFKYLKYVKIVNTYQIEQKFYINDIDDDDIDNDIDYRIIDIMIKTLFNSSNQINYIYLYNYFINNKMINKYMRDHKVYLSISGASNILNSFKNVDNLKGLTLSNKDLSNIHNHDIFFDRIFASSITNVTFKDIINFPLKNHIIKLHNLKCLSLIDSINDIDEIVDIINILKNLVYLKIFSYKIKHNKLNYISNECVKHKNLKTVRLKFGNKKKSFNIR
jgi:hypothetical protein